MSRTAVKINRFVLGLCGISLLFFIMTRIPIVRGFSSPKETMIRAAVIMKDAVSALSACAPKDLPEGDSAFDINQTGLIGLENSPLTTTLGDLEAKRTTVNPNMAALIVHLLTKIGVKEGDTVAIGASGSFPALLVAVLSAAKAMNVQPVFICSLGASQWGANRVDFHLLKMLDCLNSRGSIPFRPAAVSLGGQNDVGAEMAQETRVGLLRDIQDSGIPLVRENFLPESVRKKMEIFETYSGGRKIAGFINIGGNWTNIGTSSEILRLNPGIASIGKIPPPEQRGLIFEMAERQIPVIHLLYIRGLVEAYGLPWDPSPLPEPGKGAVYNLAAQDHPLFLWMGALYSVIFLVSLIRFSSKKKIV